jgi:hypothetical protein
MLSHPAEDGEGREVAAVRGVLGSLLGLMRVGTTYIGVATDHVTESFRNRMWPEYETGQGVEPQLLAQFPLLEETLRSLEQAQKQLAEKTAGVLRRCGRWRRNTDTSRRSHCATRLRPLPRQNPTPT